MPPGPSITQCISLALPWNKKTSRDVVQDWKDKYGKIIKIPSAWGCQVLINDYEVAKEAFTKQIPACPENIRTMMNAMFAREDGMSDGGIAFTNGGELWAEQRKITFSFVGRRANYAGYMFANARKMVERLNARINGQQTDFESAELGEILAVCIINIIENVMSGNDANENVTKQFYHLSERVLEGNISSAIMLLLPWLRHVPFFRKCFDSDKRGPALARNIQHQTVAAYQQGRRTDSGFMKHYMTSMKKLHGDSESAERTAYQHMERTMTDLYGAATETTGALMPFYLLYLAKFPHILGRIRKEVDAAWTDTEDLQYLQTSMPYTRATILELLRHVSVAFFFLHSLTSDMEIEGYRLPAKTVVYTDLMGYNYDKTYWKDPEDVKPERFIEDIDGKPTFVKDERMATFSVGKRRCPGECFALDEIFLFLIHIVKNFDIKAPEGEELDIRPLVGLVHRCRPFRCTLSRR